MMFKNGLGEILAHSRLKEEAIYMSMLAIFIDGAYLDNICRDEYHLRIDIGKLGEEIRKVVSNKSRDNVDILRMFYYDCLPYQSRVPTAEEANRFSRKRSFFYQIGRLPRVKVREGRLKFRGIDKSTGEPIFQQKKVDLQLGLDFALLSGKRSISHAAVVTGDSDLIPAFETAKEEGILVWLFHGPARSAKDGSPTYAPELWEEADERHEMGIDFFNAIKRI
jgi:uncharacterized LabA/DUF88 family protein